MRAAWTALVGTAAVVMASQALANQAFGTEFWGVQRVMYGANFGVAVVNPSSTDTATVEVSDSGGLISTALVGPGDRHVFTLGLRTAPIVSAPVFRTEDGASVRVTSDVPIAAFQADIWQPSAGSDASLLAPKAAMGTEYLMTGWIGPDWGEGYPMIHVLAVEPGDTAYTVARADGSVVEAGTLRQWQTRLVLPGTFLMPNVPDANGWRITTDRLAAVFGGNWHAYVGNSCCVDALEEQLWPVSALGTLFALSPLRAFPAGPGPRTADAFFVVASESGTAVTTVPNVGSAVLARGERLEIVTQEPFVLVATAPVQVAKFQASFGADSVLGIPTPTPLDGDPALVLVPDVRAFALEAAFTQVDGMPRHFLSIVSESGGALVLDGSPVTAACEPVGTVDGRDWCHVLVPLDERAHRLTSTRPFWAEVSSNIEQGSFAYSIVQGRVPPPLPAAPVDLDVKPGSCPNPLNFGRRGVIPAALAGMEPGAAEDLDPTTVEMEGVPALRCVLSDVTAPWEESPEACCGTPGADGLIDLVCHFDSLAVAAALCARSPQPVADDVLELRVTARTRAGAAVDVSDCIRVQQHDCGFSSTRTLR